MIISSNRNWHNRTLVIGALAALAVTGLTTKAWAADPALVDVGLETGFQDLGGHGRALVSADFDGDGWTDFYVGNPATPMLGNDDNLIFWNKGPDQNGDFKFERGPVLLQGVAAFGASAADYDNDGDPDLFIAVGGQETVGLDYLFRNDGNGTFTDVSEGAGVRGPRDARDNWVPTASLAGHWTDYDKDGDLDLFVPSRFHSNQTARPDRLGYRDSLFSNNGDGTFSDVTNKAGLGISSSTKASIWGDFDNDGWMDLFLPIARDPIVVHDYRLMRNNRDGTFIEVPLDEQALNVGTQTWASAAGDFDNNGWLDILVFARGNPNDTDSHVLLMNQGDWTFTNEGLSSLLAKPGLPPPTVMGCQVGDLDNNGYLDVVMANGGPTSGSRDHLYFNEYTDTDGVKFRNASGLFDYPAAPDPDCVPTALPEAPARFVDSSDMAAASPDDPHAVDTSALAVAASSCDLPYPYRGHAVTFTDYDKDGDVDLPMVKGGTIILAPLIDSGEPNRLFRNDGGNAMNWLFIDLDGKVSNADGLGARVEVTTRTADDGSRAIYNDARSGSCFSASGPEELHFGLGTDPEVTSISVLWPSGIRTVLTGEAINQRLKIEEPVMASSNFNEGTAPGWTVISGNWTVTGDRYMQTQPGNALAVAGQSRANYSVVGKLTYLGGQKNMGLVGRASGDGSDYYVAVLSNNSARLNKVINGVTTPLGPPMTIEPMQQGKSYIVGLTFSGPVIRMTVNGRESAPLIDTALANGTIGLATQDTAAAFDNIAVY